MVELKTNHITEAIKSRLAGNRPQIGGKDVLILWPNIGED